MSLVSGDADAFTRGLMHWHRHHNTRILPWKAETAPYRIWLSEIILQQTRALQGLPYYLKFVEAYPTVEDLAAAPEDEAFKLWEGLGYYARCRNMLATARQVVSEYGGRFPETYGGLVGLKGIGPYTAAAIASFAFGLPHAVVDGNVYRVLARYFGMDTPTDSTGGKKQFQAMADLVLDRQDPGGFNQAIMDHGATICTPAKPACAVCPVAGGCIARVEARIDRLPVRARKGAVQTRYFHYLLLHHDGSMWLRIRSGRDFWKGLYEPLLIEADRPLSRQEIRDHPQFKILQIGESPEWEGSLTQRLSHRLVESSFFSVHTDSPPAVAADGRWVPLSNLKEYPFPRTLIKFFEKKGYF